MLLVSLFTGLVGFILRLIIELICVWFIFRGVKKINYSRKSLNNFKNSPFGADDVIAKMGHRMTIRTIVFNVVVIVIALAILF